MRMYSSKRSAPPAASIAARTSSEAEGTSELGDAAVAREPGQHAEHEGGDAGDRQRSGERPRNRDGCDVTIGCRLHPHLTHDGDVVRGGDDCVDRADHRDAVSPPALRGEHRVEDPELRIPTTERRYAGE